MNKNLLKKACMEVLELIFLAVIITPLLMYMGIAFVAIFGGYGYFLFAGFWLIVMFVDSYFHYKQTELQTKLLEQKMTEEYTKNLNDNNDNKKEKGEKTHE